MKNLSCIITAAGAMAMIHAQTIPGVGAAEIQFRPQPTAGWNAVIPAEKTFPPDWEKSLFEHGEARRYEGDALMKIGMPVGGVCAGLVYLGGDGKLWWWDIFGRNLGGVMPRGFTYKNRGWPANAGSNYVFPVTTQPSPFQQGFAARITVDGKPQRRTLDAKGWKKVVFTGTYPVGTVEYSDPACPVTMTLEAYSPFIPLDTESSEFPATILRYTARNTGTAKVVVEVGGWLENPTLIDSGKKMDGLQHANAIKQKPGLTMLVCGADPGAEKAPGRPNIVFDDFEKDTYEGWTVEGTAFGSGPIKAGSVPSSQENLGMNGKHAVNSHASAPGRETALKDAATGRLTSREFVIERKLIVFLIGGGNHPKKCCVNLLVDGKVVRSATGHNSNLMRRESFDVSDLQGMKGKIEIVDNETGSWGNIGADQIVFADSLAGTRTDPTGNLDYGTMVLAAFGDGEATGTAALPVNPEEAIFPTATRDEATSAKAPFSQPLIGTVTQKLTLAPGEAGTASFVLAWHFPNLPALARGSETGQHYAKRFTDAAAVTEYLVAHEKELSRTTLLWRDSWYDSTLPVWFLDRTMANASILASTTCFRFGDGRFYTYEGVRSCAGHPNHVWHYAQAHARLFPELERDVEERTFYGSAYNDNGSMKYRGEHGQESAIDGHCGVVLSVLREHQMSSDSAFLTRLWPRVKHSVEYLNTLDKDGDGILEQPQYNTLDGYWYGEIPWISSLYIAALHAAAEMATEMGDTDFAADCHKRAETGRQAMDAKLFNGEWFVQRATDAAHKDSLGSYETVEIDQVMGQSWAFQVGLGRVLTRETTLSALRSLWKYNFATNLDAFEKRAEAKPRPFYCDGEGGLVMAANALQKKQAYGRLGGLAMYFFETMSGFEHEVAAHMIAEGMVKEGMAIERTIHDRYAGDKRNPYNEIECGDHYARAMASYGAFITACGYEYHGPKGIIGFAPKIHPENFKAAFTAAAGWGSYSQKCTANTLDAALEVKHGELRLTAIRLTPPEGINVKSTQVKTGSATAASTFTRDGDRVLVTLEKPVVIKAGESIEIQLR